MQKSNLKHEANMSRNPPGVGMPIRTDEPGIIDDTRVINSEEAESKEHRSRSVP